MLLFVATMVVDCPVRGGEEYFIVRMWDFESGLPSSTVTGVAQSPDGYLWLSTINGIARFDGVHFLQFNQSNGFNLKSGGFNQIVITSKGESLARMESGELVYCRNSDFNSLEESEGNRAERIFQSEGDSSLWVTMNTGAIARFQDGKLQVIAKSERYGGLACAPVNMNNGRYLFVTKSGILLSCNRQDSLEEISLPGGDNQGFIGAAKADGNSLLVLGDKTIWESRAGKWMTINVPGRLVGTFKGINSGATGIVWVWTDEQIWCRRLGVWSQPVKTSLTTDATFNQNISLVDREGRIWFGTNGKGLVCFNLKHQMTQISTQEGLPSNYVLCLAQDHEGNIWVATRRGLARVKQSQIGSVSWDHLQSESVATGLAEGADGSMWVGSDGDGLWQFAGRKVKPKLWSATPQSIRALVRDQQNRLWIGTMREGLWYMTNGQLNKFPDAPLPSGEARSLFAGAKERLWIGGTKGLFSLSKGELTAYPTPVGIGPIDVRAIVESKEGSEWVGTQGQGLLRLRDGHWERIDNSASGAMATVWALYEDQEGNLWIGTGGHGLACLRAGKLNFFNVTNGFIADTIYSILEDGLSNLWVGTHEGIIRLNKNDCFAVAAKRKSMLETRLFNRVDGMPTVQCASGFQPNACRTKDGHLWFSTDKGAVVIDPEVEFKTEPPPAVVIEKVLVQNSILPARSELRLGPLPRHIKIIFTALSFTAPERVKFRYRLKGEDKTWIDLGSERSVEFDSLAPRDHEFQVIACNGDGIWNLQGASITLAVIPVWWQTWWFKGLTLGLVFFVTLSIWMQIASLRYQRHLKELKRQGALDQERTRIARDIHDELGSSLTRILMLSQPADDDNQQNPKELTIIHETVRGLTRSMDEVVWAVNPRQDTLEGLVSYICLFAQDFITTANLHCRLDIPEVIPPLPMSAEMRHNVFLACKEAINNAVRHAHANNVLVSMTLKKHYFTLVIADDGDGFAFNGGAHKRQGFGLTNMSERLCLLGGSCEIVANQPKGTLVRFSVPLSHAKAV